MRLRKERLSQVIEEGANSANTEAGATDARCEEGMTNSGKKREEQPNHARNR